MQTKNTRKNGKTEKNIQLPTGFDEFSRQALLGCYVLSSYQGYIIVWKPHLALSPNLTLKLRTIQVLFHYFFAYIIGGISLYMWKKSKVSIFFPWNNLFWFVRYCFRLREIKGCLLFFLWFYIFLNRLNTKRKRKRKKEKGASQKQSLNLFNCLCLYNLCVCNIYFWANWDLSWSGSLLLQPSWFFLRWVMTPLFDSLNFFLL